MRNQLKIGALLSYVNIIANVVIGLVYTPVMLRLLGQAEYGLYSLIGSVMAYLSILDMGLGNTIVRYIAKNRATGDKKFEAELNGLFLSIYSVIGVITVIIGSILYLNIDNMFGATLSSDELSKARIMMIMLIFNFAICFPLTVFASLIQAYERFIFLRVINILRVVLNPIIALPFLLIGYGSIMLVTVTTILNISALLMNVYYCFKYLDIHFARGKFEKAFLYEVAGYAFFIFLNAVMDKIYWETGQFILGMISGTIQVAVYAIAMQFMQMYMMFSNAISGVLLPKVTMMVANGANSRDLTNLMIKIGRLQYIIISYILVMFFLVGKEFIHLWAGENYLSAYPMILILMVGLLIALVQNAGISILQAMNLNRYRMTVYTIAAVINIFTSVILAKMYGGLGCAISTAIALLISTGLIMNRYYYKRIGIDIPLFWKNITHMMPSAFILIALVELFQMNVSLEYSWLYFVIKVFVYSLIYAVLMYCLAMNGYEKNLCRSAICKVLRMNK
ncbi:oligosaccharide flippase family protein [Megamonas hypermegale]|uniref:oligosaccharide flippase family protein n=1 Tax=Megamonas hypermegale TaxID=158847 RepID=UPI0026EC054A|nr:oligosaccharide flippase family protein [Megamonas hypermegale]